MMQRSISLMMRYQVGYLYRLFLQGVLTLLPITLTLYLLTWVVSSAENAVSGPLRSWFSHQIYFPGAGVIAVVALTFAVGFLVNNFITKQLFGWVEAQFKRTPVIRSIYNPLRDVTRMFAQENENSSQRPVLVDLKGTGIYAMGLVTRDEFTDLPSGTIPPESLAVFVPFSYGVGGFTLIVPKNQTRELGIPAEKAMQLSLTGWIKTAEPKQPQ
jgi:uncharacterized membrane protein